MIKYNFLYTFLTDYPGELHDEHSDYPLAPERMVVKPEDLSYVHYCQQNTKFTDLTSF